MRKLSIKGTGSFAPERVVPNSYFEKILDTTDEWISSRTGIKERRMLEPGQGLSDMATPACRSAMEMAGVEAKDIDLIIVGTSTPDMVTPSTGCFIQEKLGATKAVPFDISAACPGFIFGLGVAEKFLQDGSHDLALVVGGEVLSTRLDYEDRGTCVLFGDGAGAVVVGPKQESDKGELLSTHLHSDGKLWELLTVEGGSKNPPTRELIDARGHFLKMQGQEIFKHAVRSMEEVAIEAMEKNDVTAEDIDWFIPHQANMRIMEVVAKRLKIPLEKVIITIHKWGNTSAGTIPMSFDDGVRSGKIKRGDLVLITSFGAGLTWGGSLFRF